MARKYEGKRVYRNRAVVAAMLPAACTKCGRVVTADMRWHADHILSRYEAEAMGMSEAQIDSPSSLGPAHASCNEKDGARLGNMARATRAPQRKITPIKREIRFSGEAETVPGGPTQFFSPEGFCGSPECQAWSFRVDAPYVTVRGSEARLMTSQEASLHQVFVELGPDANMERWAALHNEVFTTEQEPERVPCTCSGGRS